MFAGVLEDQVVPASSWDTADIVQIEARRIRCAAHGFWLVSCLSL